jgi:hypothetical protein
MPCRTPASETSVLDLVLALTRKCPEDANVEITLLNFIWIIVVVLALSLGGMLLVRTRLSVQYLRNNHEVSDPMVAVLGMLFAILLGFVLANSMDRFEQARTTVRDEAGAIGNILRLSEGLPPAIGIRIHNNCLHYIDSVIDDDWKSMKEDKLSEKAQTLFSGLWHECVLYAPQTQGESNVHQSMLDALKVASECRRTRTAQLTYHLPENLWVVVVVGAATTVVFTFFLAVESLKVQIFMTSAITLVVCLNIYMLCGFDAPYSGDIKITPAPFEAIKIVFKLLPEPSASMTKNGSGN